MSIAKPKRSSERQAVSRVLAYDVGGSHVKAALVGPLGKLLSPRQRLATPPNCTPAKLIQIMVKLAEPLSQFERIAIGFPGYVRNGQVMTAPNLGTKAWKGFKLAAVISEKLGKPARVLNDADVQGLAVVKGKGLELVCTLGTGLGTAWFQDGELLPHMELSHLRVSGHKEIEHLVNEVARKKLGNKKWNKHVKKVIENFEVVLNYDRLYLGGGNSKYIRLKSSPKLVIVTNEAGLEGGAYIWIPRKNTV